MSSYMDLDIYKIASDLAIRVHKLSLDLPPFELYEQGSQVRRSSKSIKDQITEGYGRRRYKADFIKFLVYAQASNDECSNQINTIIVLYPEKEGWVELTKEYEILGMKINKFIQFVENSWKS
jgi:four helix bundle protein